MTYLSHHAANRTSHDDAVREDRARRTEAAESMDTARTRNDRFHVKNMATSYAGEGYYVVDTTLDDPYSNPVGGPYNKRWKAEEYATDLELGN